MPFPKLNIELSQHQKIAGWSNFLIISAKQNIDWVVLLSERAGWNQTTQDLKALVSLDQEANFLATLDFGGEDIALGSGMVMPVGENLSWIGMILVHPEVRRQGIARAIMENCVSDARLRQQKAVVGLDATPLGASVYDELGFKKAYKIWRCVIACTEYRTVVETVNTEPFVETEISGYLEKKAFPYRAPIFKLLANLPNSKNFMAVSEGKVVGFVMSRPGRLKPYIGPLIANSDVIAKTLLSTVIKNWQRQGDEQLFIDVPEYHLKKATLYGEPAIERVRELTRMYQLISEKEKNHFLVKLAGEDPVKRGNWSDILDKVVESHELTLSYMEQERRDVLPQLYAIAGPEMG